LTFWFFCVKTKERREIINVRSDVEFRPDLYLSATKVFPRLFFEGRRTYTRSPKPVRQKKVEAEYFHLPGIETETEKTIPKKKPC
jgi:hypothetical protein